jgi:hypothetical protein
MGIGSISFWQQDQSYWNQSQSFYQQDQNYWNQQQNDAQATQAETALLSVIGSAETSKESGLSSIANQEALTRINNQIAADEKALSTSSGGSTSSGSSTSSSPYATATGTVPLTVSTPLSTLGIPPNGVITVSDGTNKTLYSSTGSDTVGNLINAINANAPGDAFVTASLNGSGKLVIKANNTTDTVTIGGTFASDVGFGTGNTTFKPNPAAASSSASSSASSTSASSSTASSGTASNSTSKDTAVVSAASLNASSAASILSASGVTGTLVNLLA